MRKFRRYESDIPIEIVGEHSKSQPPQPLHNISYGGLACHSEIGFQPGALVRVRISQISAPFEGDGIVVWCDPQDDGFEIGIQFREGQEAFAARMVAQVCQIEGYKKKVLETEGRELSGDEAAIEWIAENAHKKEWHERAFIRHPTDIPIEITHRQQIKIVDGQLSNFSLEGACFLSDTPLKAGEYVHLRLPSLQEQPAYAAEGCVIWCTPKDESYEVGVKFREQDKAFYSKMLNQISQIENFKDEIQRLEGRRLTGEDAVQAYSSHTAKREDPESH